MVINWLEDYNNFLYTFMHRLKKYKSEYNELKGQKSFDGNSRAVLKLNREYRELDDIKSIYLWGDPGCGKSFIAELFFEDLKKQLGDSVQFLHY